MHAHDVYFDKLSHRMNAVAQLKYRAISHRRKFKVRKMKVI